jgi:hypothetical protein
VQRRFDLTIAFGPLPRTVTPHQWSSTMWDRLAAVVAYAGFVVAIASLWLTWFDGERTRALLRALMRHDNRNDNRK